LGALSGFALNIPFAINNSGDFVGYGFNPAGDTKATNVNATDQNGSIIFGLPYPAISTGEGSEFFEGEAFLYSAKSNTITGLGNLGGGFSMAEAINSSDDVVGVSLDSSGDYHAFLYNGTAMIDLNSLLAAGSGWTLINADGINNAGDIVGYGVFDGTFEAYELTPGGTISGSGGNGGSGSGSGGGTPPNGSAGSVVPLPPALWSGLLLLGILSTTAAIKSRRGCRISD
jgi:probable HAF family extracellular repeat protein